jgi:8-oxo-dGTP pyrophosphatase MutT (NUDIX family)
MIERRVAVVFLIDQQGRILMQHRDAQAKTSPNQWGFPGGQVEDGEAPLDAAHRELFEETGLKVERLEPYRVATRPSVTDASKFVEVHAFCGSTAARQEDVVLGEGQAMVFVDPDDSVRRDLGVTAALLLPAFLASEMYAALRRAPMADTSTGEYRK